MATRDQHFVPRVYLRRWSHNGSEQVYHFLKQDLSVGEPRNVSSILFERHTYTITFRDYFLLDYMPFVKDDFAVQIEKILDDYAAIAFYNGQELTGTMLVNPKNLADIEQWEFRKKDNPDQMAKKRGIVANIKEIRSYVLESALDDYVEKKWNTLLDTFLEQLENGKKVRIGNEDIIVDNELIDKLVSMLLIFMCRNPDFDCQGIFPRVKGLLLSVFSDAAEDMTELDDLHDMINEQMRGAWLSQLYKAIFSEDIGFFSEYLKRIKEHCQVTVLHCPPDAGSFITTDTPAFSFICNVTKDNYNAIYFPLTPEYLLLIGKGKNNSLNKLDYKTLTNKGLRRFNTIILSNASQDIVSRQKYLGYLL